MEKEGRTRLALIICNKDFDYLSKRDGAEIDILGMQDLLESLGYSVVVKENLTAQVTAPENTTSFLFSYTVLNLILWQLNEQNAW